MTNLCIATLSNKPHQVSGLLLKETLNLRMNESSNNDISFLENAEYTLIVNKRIYGAEAIGTVNTKYEKTCHKCSKSYLSEFTLPIKFCIKKRPEDYDFFTDDGILFFDGDHADLGFYIEETLILAFPTNLFSISGEDHICDVEKNTTEIATQTLSPLLTALNKALKK